MPRKPPQHTWTDENGRLHGQRGRFVSAERTTTTTETVTERITVEDPASFPGDPTPVFTHLISHPPDGARWAHPGFFLRPPLDHRAAAPARAEAFVVPFDDTAPVPVIRVPVPREYEALHEDTLASEWHTAPLALTEEGTR